MVKKVYYELDAIKAMHGLKLIHVNIRSLLPKLPLVKDSFLDIILLSESWLKQGIPDNILSVSGYNIVRKDRQTSKRGGGLCVYLNHNIVYEELRPINNGDGKNLEWLCLRLSIGGNKKQIILLLYRPPNGNPEEALQDIRAGLELLQREHRNCEITVISDLNFDYTNVNCKYVKSLKMLETLFGIKQID